MKKNSLSPRVCRIRKNVVRRGGSFVSDYNEFCPELALFNAYTPGISRTQHRAAFLLELVKCFDIKIYKDWTLAGEHLAPLGGSPVSLQKVKNHLKKMKALGLDRKKVKEIEDAVMEWNSVRSNNDIKGERIFTGLNSERSKMGQGGWGGQGTEIVFSGGGWIENHSIRSFKKLIEKGFKEIKTEIEGKLVGSDISDGGFPQKENFWRAAISVCEAGIELGRRYAELAEKMAAEASSAEEKERLLKMARTCRKVPANSAETFFEAVQSLWFGHILTCGEDGINANSIGRLDNFLYPYYRNDIDSGRLTRDEAVEIMEEFACKLHLDYNVQAITLGGLDEDGNDATNELSHIILEATRNVELIRDLCVRLHKKSPDKLIQHSAELIARGGGIPFIFNDDCFVKALSDRGIPVEDARDYAPIGCIELTIPGKANPRAVSGWFNSTKCVELALFGGVDPKSGHQIGPATKKLSEMNSFEEFFQAYKTQVEFFSQNMVYNCNCGVLSQREAGPLPLWSVLTEDCIGRGRDITDGGALYNYHSVCFLGTANTADSLAAVRNLIFGKKMLSSEKLLDALRANFADFEDVRQMLLKSCPKYGNDISEVDDLAKEVTEHFIALMDKFRSPNGGRYFVHLFSFLVNLSFGANTGATPDGRSAGDPLAYSLSAHQGRDEKGVTVLFNSISKLPHSKAAGATAAIIDLDPSLVEGDEGVRNLARLIKAAIHLGVGQMQFNVVTAERLLKAQECPEKFDNIPVRVAGFSQIFKQIDKNLQDHVIARTKHRR